jgi:site-specific recombinase XerC
MAVGPVVLPTSGHAAWDDLATWWLSRYKVSTQQTYATYLPRWTAWCAGRGLNPLQAGRADVERWLRTVADSGLSRASTAGHYDAVASIYRQAFDENPIAINPCARIARPKVLRELQHREVLEYAAFLTAARALGPTHHAMSDSFSSQVSELRRTLQGAIIQLEATGSGRKLREQTRVALVAKATERIGDLLHWLHRRALERERLSGSHQDPDPSPALKDLLDEIRESGTG